MISPHDDKLSAALLLLVHRDRSPGGWGYEVSAGALPDLVVC